MAGEMGAPEIPDLLATARGRRNQFVLCQLYPLLDICHPLPGQYLKRFLLFGKYFIPLNWCYFGVGPQHQ